MGWWQEPYGAVPNLVRGTFSLGFCGPNHRKPYVKWVQKQEVQIRKGHLLSCFFRAPNDKWQKVAMKQL